MVKGFISDCSFKSLRVFHYYGDDVLMMSKLQQITVDSSVVQEQLPPSSGAASSQFRSSFLPVQEQLPPSSGAASSQFRSSRVRFLNWTIFVFSLYSLLKDISVSIFFHSSAGFLHFH